MVTPVARKPIKKPIYGHYVVIMVSSIGVGVTDALFQKIAISRLYKTKNMQSRGSTSDFKNQFCNGTTYAIQRL